MPRPFNSAGQRFDGSTLMTLFMLFAGLGLLIYMGLAYAEAAFSDPTSAFFAFVSNVVAAGFLFYGYRLLRKRSATANRASAWRRRSALAALVLCAGGAGAVIAATRRPDEARIVSPNDAQAARVDAESTRALAAGRTLFEERGCVGCHRPDGTGIGPSLHGRFGGPVEYPGSAVAVADETYLREAILHPSTIVAAGFQPVMPTFAGQLTDEQLQGLVAYVKSLSARVEGASRY